MTRARHIAWAAGIAFGILAAANLVAAVAVPPGAERVRDPGPRREFRRTMARTKPEVVLLGNSMLGSGVDPKVLRKLLKARVAKLDEGGSETAFWYLALKNVVLERPEKPRLVVIFFRDYYLTDPTYRVGGKYRKRVLGMYRGDEPLVDELAYGASLSDRVLGALPLHRARWRAAEALDRSIKEGVAARILGLGAAGPAKAIAAVFAEDKADQTLLSAMQRAAEPEDAPGKHDFGGRLPASFLPHIVALIEQADVDLAFVRVKRRRDVAPGRQPPALLGYIADLEAYLAAHDAAFIDFTGEARIREEHYGAGDHLNTSKGQPLFTRLLAKRLKPLLLRGERAAKP